MSTTRPELLNQINTLRAKITTAKMQGEDTTEQQRQLDAAREQVAAEYSARFSHQVAG